MDPYGGGEIRGRDGVASYHEYIDLVRGTHTKIMEFCGLSLFALFLPCLIFQLDFSLCRALFFQNT